MLQKDQVHLPSTRILIDCTDTFHSRRNTGIQRVVRSFAAHADSTAKSHRLTAKALIVSNGQFCTIQSVPAPYTPSGIHLIRARLNDVYLTCVHALLRLNLSPRLTQILTSHRSEFGLAWLLFQPFRLVSALKKRPKADGTGPEEIRPWTFSVGDILLLPDATWDTPWSLVQSIKEQGVKIATFVHDLIPLTHSSYCDASHVQKFSGWIDNVLSISDIVVCNSEFTRDSIIQYCRERKIATPTRVIVVPLGCDISNANVPISHRKLERALRTDSVTFIAVGTIEPRKNHSRLLDAMERRWNDGSQSRLILIGKRGWLCQEILDRIRNHREYKHKLFWFDDVDDETLVATYRRASALAFSSVVEGFGLPLVEALSHGLPAVVSDIPVFREIARDHAIYFDPMVVESIATALERMERQLCSTNQFHRSRAKFSWPSWRESTEILLTRLAATVDKKSS